jgi:putative transposase
MSRTTSLGEATVRLVCETFHLSRQAYYEAGKRGKRPSRPASRPERQGAWAAVEELEPAIRELTAKHPGWGVRKIWASLRRRGLVASQKRVWALMRHWGLTLAPVAERREEAARGHVAVSESNRRWASDLTTVWTRQDGVVALTPVIDCGDRFVFACGVSRSQEAPEVLAPLTESLQSEFGRPDEVPDALELRSDHGPQYTGTDCWELCEHWRLDHTLAPVGRPTGNAVAERFILTLKTDLLWTRDWETLDEVRQAVASWLVIYNHERPHQALGWNTPAEQRADNRGRPLLAAAA